MEVRIGAFESARRAASYLGSAAAMNSAPSAPIPLPHMMRLVVGPDHRILLPVSALGGAIFLIVADTIARTVISPAELRVGVITAFVGAPFFILLLVRNRRRANLL